MNVKDRIQLAITKGYYSNDLGEIFSKSKKLKLYTKDYLKFSIREKNISYKIRVHKFIAYILYGDIIFEKGIEIRHLDGNSLNNKYSNIKYGTKSENELDKPKLIRQEVCKNANKKYSDELILKLKEDRNLGMTYKELGEKYKLGKSTLSYYLTKTGIKKQTIF